MHKHTLRAPHYSRKLFWPRHCVSREKPFFKFMRLNTQIFPGPQKGRPSNYPEFWTPKIALCVYPHASDTCYWMSDRVQGNKQWNVCARRSHFFCGFPLMHVIFIFNFISSFSDFSFCLSFSLSHHHNRSFTSSLLRSFSLTLFLLSLLFAFWVKFFFSENIETFLLLNFWQTHKKKNSREEGNRKKNFLFSLSSPQHLHLHFFLR